MSGGQKQNYLAVGSTTTDPSQCQNPTSLGNGQYRCDAAPSQDQGNPANQQPASDGNAYLNGYQVLNDTQAAKVWGVKSQGQNCSDSYQCKPGLYCDRTLFGPLLGTDNCQPVPNDWQNSSSQRSSNVGGKCIDSYECGPGLYCDRSLIGILFGSTCKQIPTYSNQ